MHCLTTEKDRFITLAQITSTELDLIFGWICIFKFSQDLI